MTINDAWLQLKTQLTDHGIEFSPEQAAFTESIFLSGFIAADKIVRTRPNEDAREVIRGLAGVAIMRFEEISREADS